MPMPAQQPPENTFDVASRIEKFSLVKPYVQRVDSDYYAKNFPSLDPGYKSDMKFDFENLTVTLPARNKATEILVPKNNRKGSILIDWREDIGMFWSPGYQDDIQVVAEYDGHLLNTEYFKGPGLEKVSTAGMVKVSDGFYVNPKILFDLKGQKLDGSEMRLLGEINKNLKFSGGYFDNNLTDEEGYFLAAQGNGKYKKLDFGAGLGLVHKNGENGFEPGAYLWGDIEDWKAGVMKDPGQIRAILGKYGGDLGFRVFGIKNDNGFNSLQLILAKNPNLKSGRDFLNPLRNSVMREKYGSLGVDEDLHTGRYKLYFPSQVGPDGGLLYLEYKKHPDETTKLAGGGIIRAGKIHYFDIGLRSNIPRGDGREDRLCLGWGADFDEGLFKDFGIFIEGLYCIEKHKVDDFFIYLAKKFEF